MDWDSLHFSGTHHQHFLSPSLEVDNYLDRTADYAASSLVRDEHSWASGEHVVVAVVAADVG